MTLENFHSLNDGLGNHERALAQALKVDPYSTNIKLRRAVSTFSAIKPPHEPTNDISESKHSNLAIPLAVPPQLYQQNPAQLELGNRECLATMGASSSAIEKFIAANYLTPTAQTALCNALVNLNTEVDATELTSAIANSPSFAATDFLLQMLNLMVWYQSESGEPRLTRVTVTDGLPYALSGTSVVLFLPVQNLLWTRILANRVTALEADNAMVWVQGSLSAKAKAELTQRGWQIKSTPNPE